MTGRQGGRLVVGREGGGRTFRNRDTICMIGETTRDARAHDSDLAIGMPGRLHPHMRHPLALHPAGWGALLRTTIANLRYRYHVAVATAGPEAASKAAAALEEAEAAQAAEEAEMESAVTEEAARVGTAEAETEAEAEVEAEA